MWQDQEECQSCTPSILGHTKEQHNWRLSSNRLDYEGRLNSKITSGRIEIVNVVGIIPGQKQPIIKSETGR